MLMHIPGVLRPAELAQAQALLAEASWADGRHSAGPQAALAKHNQQLTPGCAQAAALQTLVLQALDRHALFFSAALPKRLLPPQFNRYGGEANHYGDHVDQAMRHGAGGQRVRTDLSCTLFLTAPEAYAGGELVVHAGAGTQAIKLPAGDAVLYPGTSVHRVEPVTRGTRLASVFWIESLVRSNDQRAMLFGMDQALMQLRQRDGESTEAIALTGCYHNLLRMWADT